MPTSAVQASSGNSAAALDEISTFGLCDMNLNPKPALEMFCSCSKNLR
jgi:hypothetical protein